MKRGLLSPINKENKELSIASAHLIFIVCLSTESAIKCLLIKGQQRCIAAKGCFPLFSRHYFNDTTIINVGTINPPKADE